MGSKKKTRLYCGLTLIQLLVATAFITLSLSNTTVMADCEDPPAGDLDGNCKVDLVDLMILTNHWQEDAGSICMCFPIGDLNENCIVDIYDLAIIASAWLEDTSI